MKDNNVKPLQDRKVKPTPIAVTCCRREDYARLREISKGDLPSTFEEFEGLNKARVASLIALGAPHAKVVIDPEGLLTFAKGRPIGQRLRAKFAASLIAKRYENGP
jgi:hypothetical protein